MSRLLPRPIAPDPALLARGTILTFDAALANTGWSLINNNGRRLEVLAAGTLRTDSDKTSHERTYDRAQMLLDELQKIFVQYGDRANDVVCERPAVAGHRIESALLGAFAVHVASRGRMQLVSRTHVLSLLLGPGTHTKAAARTAARCWVPDRGAAPFNEHIADAELAAITHMFDLAHGGVS